MYTANAISASLIKWSLIVLIIGGGIKLTAQQLNVQVLITPPYSNKLEDYIDRGNNVLISLTNTSPTVQQFKLIPTITGNNGVMATIREDFLPAAPISLSPGQTRTYTFNQLRGFNSNLQQNDLITQGIDFGIMSSSGRLPEGTYTLCVKAIEYGGTAILSGSTGGCSSFLISAYDPPIILLPQHNSEVSMPQPQLINFQWTPSGISGKTRYTIKIIDMSAVFALDPNDAFNNPAIVPYFEQSNILTSAFTYDMSKPRLFFDRSYAVQVIAYDPEGKMSYKNEGKSPAHAFTIKPIGVVIQDGSTPGQGSGIDPIGVSFPIKDNDNQGGGGPTLDPTDAPDCMNKDACMVQSPGCQGATAPNPGSIVNVGKFQMEVVSIQSGQGKGKIEMPFMQTVLDVNFQNLTANNEGVVCGASLIWVDLDVPGMIPDAMLKQTDGIFSDNGINWSSISQHMQQANKKVSAFSIGQTAKKMPFVLDLGAGELTMLGIVFTPEGAYANLAFSMAIPMGEGNDYFSMGMKGACIRPNGFGLTEAEATLNLSSDWTADISNQIAFKIKGGPNGSYVKFDCEGLSEVHLEGDVDFDRSLVVPMTADFDIVPSPATFKVNFNGTAASISDWLLEVNASHNALTTPQANGFALGFEQLILDFSKTKNANGMAFPGNHPMNNDPLKNSWTGLVIKSPTLTLPKYLKRSNDQNIQVNIDDIVLDNSGLWTQVDIENIINKLEDGSFGGWGFSMSALSLNIQQSNLAGGGISGSVNIPITEVGIGYSATYTPGTMQNDMKLDFGISLEDELEINMFFAQANLQESSSLHLNIEGKKAYPSAVLHGSLTIGWNQQSEKKPDEESNNVSSFSLPTVNFQGFTIANNDADLPQLSLESMELANINAQGLLSGFPIKLGENIKFTNEGQEVGLNLNLLFTLSKNNPNGLKGETDFTIYARYSPQKRRFVYDRTEINCITIKDLDVGVADLSGSLCIFRNDDEFGDGFSGMISATIRGINIGIDAALGVGNIDDFDYFYFEALVKMPGIPISTSMSLYGFGGGFYYNMSRADLAPKTAGEYTTANIPKDPGPGYSPSGSKYTPMLDNIGFNATVVYGLSGGDQSAAAFNGDLTFWMELNKNDGITAMGFNGGGYLVQPLNARDNAAISGEFKVIINFKQETFDMGVKLNVDIANGVVDGDGDIVMHIGPKEWFLYLGEWDTDADKSEYEPWNDKKRISVNANLITTTSFNLYFMMGSITPELPPLPGKILQNLDMQEGGQFADQRKSMPTFNEKAPGFAFGGGFHRTIDVKLLIFYADIEFFAGFDLVLADLSQANCENDFGINKWFAKGQAYAYLGVRAGLMLDLWFYEGEFELLKIEAAAHLYAEFPNPNYVEANIRLKGEVLQGLITVDRFVRFQVGNKLECLGSNAAFDDLPIVSEIEPGNGEKAEVYDDIRIAFNYPKDVFEVFNELEPDIAPEYFYYKIHSAKLSHGNVNIPLIDKPKYTKDGYSARYTTKDNSFLPGESILEFELVVKGYKVNNKGADELVAPEPPYKVTFETKKRPGHIPNQMVTSTNPIIRQRYFHKSSFPQGHVKTFNGKDFCYLFSPENIADPEVFDLEKTEYVAEFLEMGTGKVLKTNCKCVNQEVQFDVPQNLNAETMYRVRILAKLYTKEESSGSPFGDFDLVASNDATGVKKIEITKGAYKLNRYLLPDNSPKAIDHRLTEWFFKTSKYSTIQAKLNDYSLVESGKTQIWHFGDNLKPTVKKINDDTYNLITGFGIQFNTYDMPIIYVTGKEAFDVYDIQGYKVHYQGLEAIGYPVVQFDRPTNHSTCFNNYYNDMKTRYDFAWAQSPVKHNYYLPINRDYNHSVLGSISYLIQRALPQNNMGGGDVDLLWTFWHTHKSSFPHVPIELPNGLGIWEPHRPLSKQEIDDAMAATEGGNLPSLGFNNNIQVNVTPSGQSMMHQGGGKKTDTFTPVYPIINMADYLVLQDYNKVLRQCWYDSTPGKGRAKPYNTYLTLHPYLNRLNGQYQLKLIGRSFTAEKQMNYQWTLN